MQKAINYFDLSKFDHLDMCNGFSLYKGIVLFWNCDFVELDVLKFIDSIPSPIAYDLGAVHVAYNFYPSDILTMPQEFRDTYEKDIQSLNEHLTKRQVKEINVDEYQLYGINLLWHKEPESWAYKTGKVIKIADNLFHILYSGVGKKEQLLDKVCGIPVMQG